MSSRLSDLTAQAIALNTAQGRTDPDAAKQTLVGLLKADGSHADRAYGDLASREINNAGRRLLTALKDQAANQYELPFRLQESYALDLSDEEGTATRRIVQTYFMTRVEAERALEIRTLQIQHDLKARDDLRRAIRFAMPSWDQQPNLSFGRALEIALERAARKGAA